MLENSCGKVEHSGRNEKRRREQGWLQTMRSFSLQAGQAIALSLRISSPGFYIPLSLAQVWKDIRETRFIRKRGKQLLMGWENYQSKTSPSSSSKGDSGPQAVREREKTRCCQPGNMLMSLHKWNVWERKCFLPQGERKRLKSWPRNRGKHTQWGTCKRADDSLRHDFNIA